MLIAVMSDRAAPEGRVPERFEDAAALLIVETDDGTVVQSAAGEAPERYAEIIAASDAEAVVCGPKIGKACFEPIADACITRYAGDGLNALTAALRADAGTLPLIPEYEGGPGCGSGSGECGECH